MPALSPGGVRCPIFEGQIISDGQRGLGVLERPDEPELHMDIDAPSDDGRRRSAARPG